MSEERWTEASAEDGWSMKRRRRPDGRVQVQFWRLGEDGQRVLHVNTHFLRATWRAVTGEVPVVTTRGAQT
jgi:hypothetical protein